MTKPRLHLDADASRLDVLRALRKRGHDVSRTPNEWKPADASDEMQLLGATAHGRCIFSFNIRDFVALTRRHPQHGGIILAAQAHLSISELIEGLDRLLSDSTTEELSGNVRWLREWITK